MGLKQNKRLVIIDGKSIFYRGYYAMPNLKINDIPTGGIYGFTTLAFEVIKRLKPNYIAVAWDKPKTNIRRRLKLYPEYKAGRKPAPADFYTQIPILHNLLKALGWPLYELDDYEADDIMGTLAVQAQALGIETILVTSDLDLLQVIGEKIKVYILKKGLSSIELYSPESFKSKNKIDVNQFLDLKALKGDSSDNIPGVPGIGEKGALELLLEYKTLDNIYNNIELIKPALRDKLIKGKELAYLSQELARIWTDAPLKLNLKEVDGSKLNVPELIKILQDLKFKSLISKLDEIIPEVSKDQFLKASHPIRKTKTIEIKSNKDLQLIKPQHFDHSIILTRSLKKQGVKPKFIVLNFLEPVSYLIHVEQIDSKQLTLILGKIKLVTGYDLKSHLKVFLELGITKLPKINDDLLILDFLTNSYSKERQLSILAEDELNYSIPEVSDLDDDSFGARAGEIIQVIWELHLKLWPKLENITKLFKLANEIEFPVITVLARMEKWGIKLDINYLKEFDSEVSDYILTLEQKIYGFADQEFNIASPSQLADVLFSRTKLNLETKGLKKTKTGYSTAASELLKLIAEHPIIENILQYREVTKLKNTYIDALPKLIDQNSKLHTTFSLTSAQTGRLSSLEPNLQNIPIRTELGRNIRRAFVAEPGNVFINADYSQFELRLAAFLANDQDLMDQFNRGIDIHTVTAAQIYGREQEDVTAQMRRSAKIINFGILYGMSPHGLSIATGMNMTQATDFIEKYKTIRKPIFDYMDRTLQRIRKDGYSETYFGRRRYFPDINSPNFQLRQAAERAALNMPIQGTEADLMKMAMIKCQKELDQHFNNGHILLQIHDSLLVECPDTIKNDTAKIVQETMTKIYKLPVELKVDVKIGQNWSQL
jgi:DNA polymerase-1